MIRPATIADLDPIARIHVLAWQVAYRNLVPAELLNNLSVPEQIDRWTKRLSSADQLTLVFGNPAPIGWICFGPGRDATSHGQGEVYAIYIDPRHWRSGIGCKLMAQAEIHLHKTSPTIYLWVLAENLAARRFYEAMDYRPSEEIRDISWAGATLCEIKYVKVGDPPVFASP